MADPTLYQMVVGSLQYLTLTRPDISFAVCQFMHSPAKDHWQTVKWILRYLKHTSNFGLLLQPTSTTRLQAFQMPIGLVVQMIGDPLQATNCGSVIY